MIKWIKHFSPKNKFILFIYIYSNCQYLIISNYKLLTIHLYIIIFRRLKFKDFSKINSELIEEKVQLCYNIFNQSNNFGIFLHKISIKDKWFEALSTNCTFKKKKKKKKINEESLYTESPSFLLTLRRRHGSDYSDRSKVDCFATIRAQA